MGTNPSELSSLFSLILDVRDAAHPLPVGIRQCCHYRHCLVQSLMSMTLPILRPWASDTVIIVFVLVQSLTVMLPSFHSSIFTGNQAGWQGESPVPCLLLCPIPPPLGFLPWALPTSRNRKRKTGRGSTRGSEIAQLRRTGSPRPGSVPVISGGLALPCPWCPLLYMGKGHVTLEFPSPNVSLFWGQLL